MSPVIHDPKIAHHAYLYNHRTIYKPAQKHAQLQPRCAKLSEAQPAILGDSRK